MGRMCVGTRHRFDGRLQLARTRAGGDGGDDDGARDKVREEETVCEPGACQDRRAPAGGCVGAVVDGLLNSRRTQEKPSDEELAELMQRMKEQNEKIKQRRLVSTRARLVGLAKTQNNVGRESGRGCV